ncbi:PAS domain S-box protein [Thalassospira sp. MA62]|nr:PAS domain S-box protein [Thalassospira sp. MA62]
MIQHVQSVLHRTQNRIADFMLMVMAIGGVPNLVGAMMRQETRLHWVPEIMQIAMFLVVIGCIVWRRQLSAQAKARAIILNMTCLALLYVAVFSPASGMAIMTVSTVMVAIFKPLGFTIRYAILGLVIMVAVGAVRMNWNGASVFVSAVSGPDTLGVWFSVIFGYAWMSAALVAGVMWMRQSMLQLSMDQMLSENERLSGHKFLQEIRTSAADVASYFSTVNAIEHISFRPSLERFAQILDCDRASLWLQNEEGELVCEGLFDTNNLAGLHEFELLPQDKLPIYYRALETGQAIDASNVLTDPRTAEFAECYSKPKGIQSKLDVSLISVSGRLGVLCFETVGRSRRWRQDEIVFAHMAAGLLAAAAGMKSLKMADAEIVSTRERFEAVANYTYGWESWISPNGKLSWVNPGIERILGYSVAECLNDENYPINFVASQDRDRVRHYIEEGLAGLTGDDRELTCVHKDGHKVEISMSWQPIKHRDGSNLGVRISCRDVTDRIRARRDLLRAKNALESNQGRLRAHFNNAKIGVFYWTPNRRIVEANETAARMFGYDVDELVGKKLEAFVPENQRYRLTTLLSDILRTRSSVNNCFENITRSGKRIFCEWYESPIFDAEGNLECIASFALDITERVRYQETLESIYRGVRFQVGTDFFENLTRVMCESLNMTYCHIGEINQGRVKSVAYYSKDTRRKGLDFELKNSAAEKVIEHGVFVCEDGFQSAMPGVQKLTDIDVRGYVGGAIYDNNGEPIGVLVTVSDQPISDPELARSIIDVFAARASSELQRIREERRRETLEQQMRHSQRMETIGVLAGGIAHDFNNILQPISGYAELIYGDLPEGSPMRDDVMEIRHGADRARDLVKQILAFSRNAEAERSIIDIASMINGTARFARGFLPSSVTLQVNISDEVTSVLGNATQLDQCLMNLLTNAYHAVGDKGDIKLDAGMFDVGDDNLSSHALLSKGRYVRISVADDGCGMDAQTVEKIFDPFFTTKEPGKGTGLGLSTVHGIITAHKGDISVVSQPGQGSRFSILLPELVSQSDPQDNIPPTDFATRRGGHVLILDDEEKNLKICTRMLERLGYQATTFADPTDALHALQDPSMNFDIVLTDQTMPTMTGLELIDQMRAQGYNLPVIIMTGYASDALTDACRNASLTHLLAKPIDIVDLHDALETVLQPSMVA